MSKASYAEVLEDGGAEQRANERVALTHGIGLLQEAAEKDTPAHRRTEALLYINRLWAFLLEDLVKSDNALPAQLRADLISIGIWVLRETEAIRLGQSENFADLITINTIIRDGMK